MSAAYQVASFHPGPLGGPYRFLAAEILFPLSGRTVTVYASNRPGYDERSPWGRDRIVVGDWTLTIETPDFSGASKDCARVLLEDAEALRDVLVSMSQDELAHLNPKETL